MFIELSRNIFFANVLFKRLYTYQANGHGFNKTHINKFGIAIAVVLPVPGGAATMTESVSFVLINLLPKTPNTMPIGIWMLFAAFSSEKLNNDYGNSRWAKLKDIKKMNIGHGNKAQHIL
jgi:hypothetical protein